jgi:poly(A) polymerase
MMGVTPPISTEPPKPSDVQASESELNTLGTVDRADEIALMNDLVAMNQFESDGERRVRSA